MVKGGCGPEATVVLTKPSHLVAALPQVRSLPGAVNLVNSRRVDPIDAG